MGDVTDAVTAAQERSAVDPELDFSTASSDTMMAVDLPNGMCGLIARCCDTPRPHVRNWKDGSAGGSHSVDVRCDRCGSTLAVVRWRQ